MKIQFVLPGRGRDPAGGYRVVYEYANRLSAKGHQITISHCANRWRDASWKKRLARLMVYWYARLLNKAGPRNWFSLSPSVDQRWVYEPSEARVVDADAVIATSWETAEWVAAYPAEKGRKLYLIQGLETWSSTYERVIATWRLPLRKLVIARWLEDLAQSLGEASMYLPNGLDWEHFGIDRPIDERVPASVMVLYHPLPWKGFHDALAALALVATRIPNLSVTVFGVPRRAPGLPNYARYVRLPSRSVLRELYNNSAIFLTMSTSEGWGLPACEAMMCGCALVATDIGGHREFAAHDQNALLVPPHGVVDAAEGILRLVRDGGLRYRLAMAGHQRVRQFTWEAATDCLEVAIHTACDKATSGPLD